MIFNQIPMALELVRTIRSIERRKHIPLIAVTANWTEELEGSFKTLGFDDFIIKPLTIESLVVVLPIS